MPVCVAVAVREAVRDGVSVAEGVAVAVVVRLPEEEGVTVRDVVAEAVGGCGRLQWADLRVFERASPVLFLCCPPWCKSCLLLLYLSHC